MRLLYLITITLVFAYFLMLFRGNGDAVTGVEIAEPELQAVSRPQSSLIIQGDDAGEVHTIKQLQAGEAADAGKSVDTGTLYKWKAGGNVTVISMEPPPEGTAATKFLYSNAPTEPASSIEIVTNTGDDSKSPAAVPSFQEDPLRVYTPEGLKEFIEYSKEIGEKIELRGEELEELVKML